MVFFALTRLGYNELLGHLGKAPSPLWVNEGVLSDSELEQLRLAGAEVTNFTSAIDPRSISAVEDAIHTVQEHHAGEIVWVEHVPNL